MDYILLLDVIKPWLINNVIFQNKSFLCIYYRILRLQKNLSFIYGFKHSSMESYKKDKRGK